MAKFLNYVPDTNVYVLVEDEMGTHSIRKTQRGWSLVQSDGQETVCLTFETHSEVLEWVKLWLEGFIQILPAKPRNLAG